MIDCNITENYLKEQGRMCKENAEGCTTCPFWAHDNCTQGSEELFEQKKAIAIVQAWSDGHPPKTYLSDFLEKYPKAVLQKNGAPMFCLTALGFDNMRDCNNCIACWSRPIEG